MWCPKGGGWGEDFCMSVCRERGRSVSFCIVQYLIWDIAVCVSCYIRFSLHA